METHLHRELSPQLEARWIQLQAESGRVTPFQACAWLRAYLTSFGPKEIGIIELIDLGKTVGIVPVQAIESRRYLRRLRWLEFAGARYADYCTALFRPDLEREAARSIIGALRSDWDGIYFGNFRTGQEFLNGLTNGIQDSHLYVRPRDCSAVRSLSLATYESLSQSGTHWSSDKLLKKLEKKGKLEFEVHTSFDGIVSLLPLFFKTHKARFASRGLQSPFEDPQQEQFFLQLAKEFSNSGGVWLSVLSCGGQPAAMRFSLRGGDCLHLYSTCFADEFANLSPSSHQLRFLLESAFKSGIRSINFGIGASPHKELPGTEVTDQLVALEIYKSRVGVLEARVFDYVQQLKRYPFVERLGKRLRKVLPNTT